MRGVSRMTAAAGRIPSRTHPWKSRIVGEGDEAPDQLLAHPLNRRTHPDSQQGALGDVLDRVGWVQRVIVNRRTGHLVDGHLRVKLAMRRDEPTIPVLYVDLDEDEERLVLATIDPLSAMAGRDEEILAKLLDGIEDSIPDALREVDRTPLDEDETPEVPKVPTTKVGDVWTLGRHRFACGDSTDAETVALAMGGAAPFIMVTDPPYGVDYDPNWRQELASKGVLAKADRALGKVMNDDRADWSAAFVHFLGDVVYAWSAQGALSLAAGAAIQSIGFEIRNMLVWRKARLVISRGAYHYQHEPCWYAVRKGASAKWAGDRKQTSVWDIPHAKNDTGHGTQKPVECMARPIRNHGARGDFVFDPFLGSGTTLVAAEQLDRNCVGLELDPGYCDVIVERWENLTGGKATRERGGKSDRSAPTPKREKASAA